MIVITGASRGLGRYLLEEFRKDGTPVMGTYNSTAACGADDQNYYKVDVSDYDQVRNWVASARDRLTNIVLINCAAVSYNSFAHKADIEKWHKVIEVNVNGTFNVIHEILPLMRGQGYGRIINMSSVAAELPTAGISAYATSKSALWGLSRSLAAENASRGITVNCINLGYAAIGMGLEEVPAAYQNKLLETIPAGRFADPAEIMNTVKYIVNTEYINGANININGGLI